MRRIVAPAGTAFSTVVKLAQAATYLINSILKLGQSVTHVCKLPMRIRWEMLSPFGQVVGFDARQFTPPRSLAGVLQ